MIEAMQEIDAMQKTKDALLLWAEWMGRDSNKLGYPSKALMLCSGAGSDFDDMAESCDNYLIQCVDTAVDNLPLPQRMAIHHRYLSAVYSFARLSYADLLYAAHESIHSQLMRKGAIG